MCDTVASYFGLGKKKVLNVLSKNVINLNLIGNLEESVDDCFNQGRIFILQCYNQDTTKTLNSARKKTWKSMILRNKSGAPKLESLPPTDEAFFQNLKRAHLQIAVWKSSINC